ncbi:MAG: Crp/Fnr family transcriptional regulator [Oscillospiraceae bacterium]|nr:Crp/Fnr family transcriptional regulator [Oscillospiraceae bacterium]
MLKENILFKGLDTDRIQQIIHTTGTREVTYAPGEIIMHQGDVAQDIGIVLQGSAIGKKYTRAGEEIIASVLTENKIFGDVLSGADGFASPVTVQAVTKCTVLFINYKNLLYSSHPQAHKILQNMIRNISMKYFVQNKRMEILMLKSVRSKITTYLEWQADSKGGRSFTIDMDRQLMADFLGVERSALSRELSRMKKDGLIDYHKNHFVIL